MVAHSQMEHKQYVIGTKKGGNLKKISWSCAKISCLETL